jgi:autotransporter-associated beta strand protein
VLAWSAIGFLFLSLSVATAANYTWGGGISDWNDTSPSGWNGGPPASGSDTATITNGTVTLDYNNQANTLASITIGGSGKLSQTTNNCWNELNNLTLKGGTLESVSPPSAAFGSYQLPGTVTVSGSIPSTISTKSGVNTWINLGLAVNNSPTYTTFTVADVTASSAADLTVSTTLADNIATDFASSSPAGLIKTGSGTLELDVPYTYTGNTTVNAGTLTIGGNCGYDQTLAGGAVTVSNGATILITSTANNALPFQGGTPAWTVAGTVNVTGGGANTIPAAGVVLNNGTLTGTPANTQYGTFISAQAANVTITANGSANAISSDNFAVSQTLTLDTPLAGDALVASSGFFDAFAGAGSLAKSGPGAVTLSGASTFTGGLTMNAGTLFVNGSVTSGATVSGGTLAGSGTIGGATTINAGASLAAGSALSGIGTLTLNSDLTVNGNVLVNLKKGQAQSNSVFAVSGVLTNANGATTTLTVSNLGPALLLGDKFTVFSKALEGGASVTIVPPVGYTLNNNLATDGSISLASTPAPPTLSYSKSGTNLSFNWTGSGSLEWQTNALNKGLGTNWVAYPNGTNGVTVLVDTAKDCVFFRVRQ